MMMVAHHRRHQLQMQMMRLLFGDSMGESSAEELEAGRSSADAARGNICAQRTLPDQGNRASVSSSALQEVGNFGLMLGNWG